MADAAERAPACRSRPSRRWIACWPIHRCGIGGWSWRSSTRSTGRCLTLGTPIKVDGQLALDIAPPARLGEHTDAVLGELLGYPKERVATLRLDGIVA